MGARDVRVPSRRRSSGCDTNCDRGSPRNPLGQGNLRLLHSALHLRERLRREREIHAGKVGSGTGTSARGWASTRRRDGPRRRRRRQRVVARLVEMVNEAAENLPDWEDPRDEKTRAGMARRALAGGVRTVDERRRAAMRVGDESRRGARRGARVIIPRLGSRRVFAERVFVRASFHTRHAFSMGTLHGESFTFFRSLTLRQTSAVGFRGQMARRSAPSGSSTTYSVGAW